MLARFARQMGRFVRIRRYSMLKTWAALTLLAAEAHQVISLRCQKLAAGGSRAAETFATAAQTFAGLMSGAIPTYTAQTCRAKVRDDRRRLSR